jgi:hypothetical protein
VTLVSSLITSAYRESNALSLGKVPNPNQSTEALDLYNGIISAIYGGDAGEQLNDWPLGNFGRQSSQEDIPLTAQQIDHPTINRRLIAVNESPMTVYLSVRPQDGARYGIVDPFGRLEAFPVTLDANGRTIEDTATLVLNTDGLNREWFYRADLGSWVRLTDLAAGDENPFPKKFDQMFIIMLAMRINPRYGRTLDEQSIVVLKQGKREFIARYLQSQPLEIDDSISWPFMSAQSYDTQRQFSSQTSFDRGDYPWYGR